MEISLKADIDEAFAVLDRRLHRQVPFAAARALTAVAKHAQEAQKREMADVFDRPRPYTLNATWVKPATKVDLTAVVKLKDITSNQGIPASKYLLANIKGGERRLKKHEKALRAARVLPPGMFALPGNAAKMDAYGNIRPSEIVKVLSYFRSFPEQGYKNNSTEATRAKLRKGTRNKYGKSYFVGSPGRGLPLGVWEKTHTGFGSAIKPILIFVDGNIYQRIYEFGYVAKKAVQKHWAKEFVGSLREAIRTAR